MNWHPVSLNGTQFRSHYGYTHIGDETLDSRVKLGPKDRVTLRRTKNYLKVFTIRATIKRLQGAGSNEIEHSYWSRALNWSQGL